MRQPRLRNVRLLAPWVLSLVLAVALVFEWRRAEAAHADVLALQATAAEMSSLYLELKAEHAKWLTLGLRELRAGREDRGFQALDTLLASTVRGIDTSGPHGHAARDADTSAS